MDTLTAIESRRSVKRFDPAFEMPAEDIDRLMSLALLSPTSFNIQNWRFVLVRDPETLQQVRAAAWDQAQVSEASLTIVLCADLKAAENDPQRYWRDAPQAVQDLLVPMIIPFYKGNEQLQRDEAMRSCGIAAQTLMLAARAMGYDSCPMIGFDPQKVAGIINLPDDHVIAMMLVIGKPLQPAHARGGQVPQSEVVVVDQFSAAG